MLNVFRHNNKILNLFLSWFIKPFMDNGYKYLSSMDRQYTISGYGDLGYDLGLVILVGGGG